MPACDSDHFFGDASDDTIKSLVESLFYCIFREPATCSVQCEAALPWWSRRPGFPATVCTFSVNAIVRPDNAPFRF